MKKNLAAMVLIISITVNLYGQKKAEVNIFELPPDKISRIFFIELDKGNKIRFELTDPEDLQTIYNIDSVLQVFIQDIEPLKDSLANELLSKRIDYIIDATGKNKIRIQQFAPVGSTYLVNRGDIAALKLAQDTINIISKTKDNIKRMSNKNTAHFHYYRISIFLNNLNDLTRYMGGQLQNQITEVQQKAATKWVSGKDGMMHLKTDPLISSNTAHGQVAGSNDYLNLRLTSDIQNYKNYFVPSLSFGVAIITNRNSIKREFSLMSEWHFSFAKNDQGKLQTFRNTFLKSNPHLGLFLHFHWGI